MADESEGKPTAVAALTGTGPAPAVASTTTTTATAAKPAAADGKDALAKKDGDAKDAEEKKEGEEEEEDATFQESGRVLFTMRALRPSMLPKHGELPVRQGDQRGKHPELRAFVEQVLREALTFVDSEFGFFKDKGTKASKGSAAKVELYAKSLNNRHGSHEAWFARRSIHESKAQTGTATWDEFLSGLYEGHSVNEKEYTPDCFDAIEVISWDEEVKAAFASSGGTPSQWSEVGMRAYEMAHKIPGPLSNRAFPELIVQAKYTPPAPGKSAFIFVQIPVELATSKKALYSTGENKTVGSGEQKKKAVIGRYVSVERLVQREDGNVVWEMATASDAAGAVPVPLQKLGVPGAIVKDVGLFFDWVGSKRK